MMKRNKIELKNSFNTFTSELKSDDGELKELKHRSTSINGSEEGNQNINKEESTNNHIKTDSMKFLLMSQGSLEFLMKDGQLTDSLRGSMERPFNISKEDSNVILPDEMIKFMDQQDYEFEDISEEEFDNESSAKESETRYLDEGKRYFTETMKSYSSSRNFDVTENNADENVYFSDGNKYLSDQNLIFSVEKYFPENQFPKSDFPKQYKKRKTLSCEIMNPFDVDQNNKEKMDVENFQIERQNSRKSFSKKNEINVSGKKEFNFSSGQSNFFDQNSFANLAVDGSELFKSQNDKLTELKRNSCDSEFKLTNKSFSSNEISSPNQNNQKPKQFSTFFNEKFNISDNNSVLKKETPSFGNSITDMIISSFNECKMYENNPEYQKLVKDTIGTYNDSNEDFVKFRNELKNKNISDEEKMQILIDKKVEQYENLYFNNMIISEKNSVDEDCSFLIESKIKVNELSLNENSKSSFINKNKINLSLISDNKFLNSSESKLIPLLVDKTSRKLFLSSNNNSEKNSFNFENLEFSEVNLFERSLSKSLNNSLITNYITKKEKEFNLNEKDLVMDPINDTVNFDFNEFGNSYVKIEESQNSSILKIDEELKGKKKFTEEFTFPEKPDKKYANEKKTGFFYFEEKYDSNRKISDISPVQGNGTHKIEENLEFSDDIEEIENEEICKKEKEKEKKIEKLKVVKNVIQKINKFDEPHKKNKFIQNNISFIPNNNPVQEKQKDTPKSIKANDENKKIKLSEFVIQNQNSQNFDQKIINHNLSQNQNLFKKRKNFESLKVINKESMKSQSADKNKISLQSKIFKQSQRKKKKNSKSLIGNFVASPDKNKYKSLNQFKQINLKNIYKKKINNSLSISKLSLTKSFKMSKKISVSSSLSNSNIYIKKEKHKKSNFLPFSIEISKQNKSLNSSFEKSKKKIKKQLKYSQFFKSNKDSKSEDQNFDFKNNGEFFVTKYSRKRQIDFDNILEENIYSKLSKDREIKKIKNDKFSQSDTVKFNDLPKKQNFFSYLQNSKKIDVIKPKNIKLTSFNQKARSSSSKIKASDFLKKYSIPNSKFRNKHLKKNFFSMKKSSSFSKIKKKLKFEKLLKNKKPSKFKNFCVRDYLKKVINNTQINNIFIISNVKNEFDEKDRNPIPSNLEVVKFELSKDELKKINKSENKRVFTLKSKFKTNNSQNFKRINKVKQMKDSGSNKLIVYDFNQSKVLLNSKLNQNLNPKNHIFKNNFSDSLSSQKQSNNSKLLEKKTKINSILQKFKSSSEKKKNQSSIQTLRQKVLRIKSQRKPNKKNILKSKNFEIKKKNYRELFENQKHPLESFSCSIRVSNKNEDINSCDNKQDQLIKNKTDNYLFQRESYKSYNETPNYCSTDVVLKTNSYHDIKKKNINNKNQNEDKISNIIMLEKIKLNKTSNFKFKEHQKKKSFSLQKEMKFIDCLVSKDSKLKFSKDNFYSKSQMNNISKKSNIKFTKILKKSDFEKKSLFASNQNLNLKKKLIKNLKKNEIVPKKNWQKKKLSSNVINKKLTSLKSKIKLYSKQNSFKSHSTFKSFKDINSPLKNKLKFNKNSFFKKSTNEAVKTMDN